MNRPIPAFQVVSLATAREMVAQGQVNHLISVNTDFIPPDSGRQIPEGLDYLRITHSDPSPKLQDAVEAHKKEIAAAVAMTRRVWDAGEEMVFHCRMGQSRSPSFAFAMIAVYLGDDMEQAVAENAQLQALSKEASPISVAAIVEEYLPAGYQLSDYLQAFCLS